MLNVDEIQNGIVIDHITAGKGKQIYDLLNLGALPQISVALLQNVRSNKYGSKDIIKLEGDATFDFPILGYLDPYITVTHICNGNVTEKFSPELPEKLVDVITCKNPRCITSVDTGCHQIFHLSARGRYRCQYCEEEYTL